MKTKHIHIVIEEQAYRKIRQTAFDRGMSMGAYIRQCVASREAASANDAHPDGQGTNDATPKAAETPTPSPDDSSP